MQTNPAIAKNSGKEKLIFLLSLLTAVFFCLGNFINVYHIAFVGAFFELLWLPMLLLLFLLPVLSIIALIKEKFNARSLYLYSILLIVITLLLMVFRR